MDPKIANIITIIAGLILLIIGISYVFMPPVTWYSYVTFLAGVIVIIVGVIGLWKGKTY